jgi:alpha-beta hydrolase superfamily lysophospholipase
MLPVAPARLVALSGWLAVPLVAALVAYPTPAAGQDRPAASATEEESPPPEPLELRLETSDGVGLAVQYFPVAGDAKPAATVILVHDLGGSSDALAPLASTLQRAGCAVLVPDLRGHGESSIPAYERAAADGDQSKLLKLPDFKAMAITGGGRVRGQSDLRGDIEAVRHWIKQQADAGKLDLDKLVVVGSGLGGAVAATWTVADAAWPPIATGAQGGHVQALVLVDPAFATKGFLIGPALSNEPVKSRIPIMIMAGTTSRDAGRIFDQLKRSRPTEWFDSRLYDATERRNTSPAKDSEATLLFVQVDARDRAGRPLDGDALAAMASSDPQQRTPAALIAVFVRAIADRPR